MAAVDSCSVLRIADNIIVLTSWRYEVAGAGLWRCDQLHVHVGNAHAVNKK